MTYSAGQLRLVQIDETATATTVAHELNTLGAGQLAEANGNLALLRNEEALEIWSTASVPSGFRRIGEGSAGGGQQGPYPVGLLHDGRVGVRGSTTGIATLKPTAAGAVYDFDSPVVGPSEWTPSVAFTDEGAVITHPAGAYSSTRIPRTESCTRRSPWCSGGRRRLRPGVFAGAHQVLLLEAARHRDLEHVERRDSAHLSWPRDGATDHPNSGRFRARVRGRRQLHPRVGSRRGRLVDGQPDCLPEQLDCGGGAAMMLTDGFGMAGSTGWSWHPKA